MISIATRRERVILELEDRFTTGMARAAAASALLDKELNSLSGNAVQTRRAVSDVDREIDHLGGTTRRSGREIDQYSGRLKVLAEAAVVLGPAFIPVGAVAVPAISGLSAQLGFAAVGAGVAMLAFEGLGDALTKVNKAAIDPTDANLKAANLAMQQLPESARQLVTQLHDLTPELLRLRTAAADGLLPGVSAAISDLEDAMPRLTRVISVISGTLGEIAKDTGESLTSDRWAPFLEFIADEAPKALTDLASIVGSTAHGLAELWIAFTPINDDFSTFLVDAAAKFDHFASGLSQTNGFTQFINYVRENGPQVADTFGAVGNALLQITEAAAPLGGPVLKGIEAVANALSAIADSDLGTPLFTAVAALSLFNRGLKTAEALSAFGARLDVAGEKAQGFGRRLNGAILGRSALLLGGLAVAGTGAADGIGLTNTAALTLAGSALPGLGTAIGFTAGLTLDFAHANDELTSALNRAGTAAESNSIAQIKSARAVLAAQAQTLNTKTQRSTLGFLTHPGDFLAGVSAFASNQDEELVSRTNSLNIKLRELQQGPLKGVGSLLTQGLGRPARQAALDVDGAATAAARFSQSLAGLNEKLQQSQTQIAFRTAIRELGDVVKNNPLGKSLDTGLDKQGKQGDAVRQQLLTIIQLTLQTASGLNSVDQIGFLRRARAEILQRATDLGIPKKAVEDLITSFGILDRTKADPKVGLDDHEFTSKKKRIETFLDYLANKEVAPTISFKARVNDPVLNTVLGLLDGSGKKKSGTTDLGHLLFAPAGGAADGTTVPGSRQPYGDRIPFLLAPGEEVVSNRFGQADRHRDLLKAINANRLADGGTVMPFASTVSNTYYGSQASSVGLSAGDMRAIASLVASARPLYGDVHMQPHNYNQFRREMEQDRVASAGDGVSRG